MWCGGFGWKSNDKASSTLGGVFTKKHLRAVFTKDQVGTSQDALEVRKEKNASKSFAWAGVQATLASVRNTKERGKRTD
eukprot:418424-Amphidinium_carterae.1